MIIESELGDKNPTSNTQKPWHTHQKTYVIQK